MNCIVIAHKTGHTLNNLALRELFEIRTIISYMNNLILILVLLVGLPQLSAKLFILRHCQSYLML